MRALISKAAAAAILTVFASTSHALTWNWSFASEAGTFITGGAGAPGTYTIADFSVTSSATGGTIGSQSGGAYVSGGFVTTEPYTFDWDGTAATAWHHSGSNTFDWIVYGQTSDTDKFYFFGWNTGNLNDPTSGAHYSILAGIDHPISQGTIHLAPVPEPETYALMLVGLALIASVAHRRRAK